MHTYSTTDTVSYTKAHAKQLASKIVTELYQCHRHYGRPSRASVSEYEQELIELLSGEYVAAYEFGFKRNDARVVCWEYKVRIDGSIEGGDSAGGVYARADVADASYYNFLSYSDAWFQLSDADKARVKERLPFKRGSGSLPSDGDGYWAADRAYVAGGRRVERRTFRPW